MHWRDKILVVLLAIMFYLFFHTTYFYQLLSDLPQLHVVYYHSLALFLKNKNCEPKQTNKKPSKTKQKQTNKQNTWSTFCAG